MHLTVEWQNPYISQILTYSISLYSFLLQLFASNNAKILRLLCKRFANFTIIQSNTLLQGSTLETFSNMDIQSCQFKCLMNWDCKSINTNEDENNLCQLNNQTIESKDGKALSTLRSGWTYWSTDYNITLVSQP